MFSRIHSWIKIKILDSELCWTILNGGKNAVKDTHEDTLNEPDMRDTDSVILKGCNCNPCY